MNDQELESTLAKAARLERKITHKVLRLICLAEDRRLYAKRGYQSMHKWLVQRFHYSDSAAGRRIQAAKLLRAVPEIGAKVETGEVNLSTLGLAQRAMIEHQKNSGETLSNAQKSEVVQLVENKSASQAEIQLMALFPDIALKVQQEHKTIVNADTIRMAANFPKEIIDAIEQIRQSANLDGGFAQVVSYLVKNHLATQGLSGTKKRRDEVVKKGCEYQDLQSGKICGARTQLEVDHIVPVAQGGSDAPENKRCLCRTHNLLAAREKLGDAHADFRGLSTRSLQLKAVNRVAAFRSQFHQLAGTPEVYH